MEDDIFKDASQLQTSCKAVLQTGLLAILHFLPRKMFITAN